VAGRRWTMERSVEVATGEVGREDSEVRRWTGWYRPRTLAMWAYALRTVLRAGRRLATWNAGRGLGSHCSSRRGASASGAGFWGCHRRRTTSSPGHTGAAGLRWSPSRTMTNVVGYCLRS
jgi:hypothetical protein